MGLFASIHPAAFGDSTVTDADPLRFEEIPLFSAMTSSEESVGPYDAPPWQPLTTLLQQVANSSSPTRISGFLGNLAVGRNFAWLKPF